MTVLIIEDEAAAVRRLKRLLSELNPGIRVLASAASVETAITWLEKNPAPDLIFMDVELEDGLSFEIFERVKVETPVIFCTAYDKYAIQAFRVNSIDYLLKPIEKENLASALQKLEQLRESFTRLDHTLDVKELIRLVSGEQKPHKSRFLIKVGKQLVSIPVTKIAYFYTEFKFTNVVTIDNKRFPLEHSLESLEELLAKKKFFRVNRQIIVSLDNIRSIENEYGRLLVHLMIPTKHEIVVSREKASAFKHWLDQ